MIRTGKRPWSQAFPGTHLILELSRYADRDLRRFVHMTQDRLRALRDSSRSPQNHGCQRGLGSDGGSSPDSVDVLAKKELIGTVDATDPDLFFYTMSTPCQR